MIKRVVVGPLETNCWILHDSNQALVIDPGDAPDRVLDAVAGLTVTAVVLTHTHADHVLGVAALKVPVIGHAAEEAVWRHELAHLAEHGRFDAGTSPAQLLPPDTPLWRGRFDSHVDDGDSIALGQHEIRVLHTPGHTPGGITLAVPGHLFTGDTLFPGGPGLTGWPLSDFAAIMTSVRRLLTEFPADTVIHPGHGLDTTISRERPSVDLWQKRGW